MQFLEKSSQQEMIAEWLKGEMWSKRFSGPLKKILRKFKQGQGVVNNPKLDNKRENVLRKKILFTYRKDILRGFPKNITWQKVTLNLYDLEKIKYINQDYLNERSLSVRLAKEAVKHVKKHGWFPKMILISTQPGAPVVVLEGHLRLTAYLMAPEAIPNKLIAFIGYSPEFAGWDLYQKC